MAFSMLTPRYRSWWDTDRLIDQHFGMGLFDSDLLPPVVRGGCIVRPRTQNNRSGSGTSDVKCDKDKFQVMLNVRQFKPEEMTVKTVDNTIVIHGKHEEVADEHGFISREFTRRYVLPEGVEPETVTSCLTVDGILTIEAPRKALEPPPANERVVPVVLQQPAAVEAENPNSQSA